MMGDQRLVFNAGVEAYVDDGAYRPPICKHSRQCLMVNGKSHAQRKYYTLPLACIQSGCKIDKWTLATDKSHLQLQCGITLQLVLNEMLANGTVTVHEYYETLNCFKKAVYSNLFRIKDLQFSQKRRMPLKISGKLTNYKNENNIWVFFVEIAHISIGKLTFSSPSMKICATK